MTDFGSKGSAFLEIERTGTRVIMVMNCKNDYDAIAFYDHISECLRENRAVSILLIGTSET